MKLRLALLTSLFVLVAAAPAAGAVQRYASPTGFGTACTAKAPCDLETAMYETNSGDEVIIGSGDYAIKHAFVPANNDEETEATDRLFIHGDFNSPMPTIHSSMDETAVISFGGSHSILSWVDVTATGPESTAICCAGRMERVRARSTGVNGDAIVSGYGVVADSLAISSGASGTAIFMGSLSTGGSGSVLGSTAIATGEESNAVVASFADYSEKFGSYALTVTDTIADGRNSDLFAQGSSNDETAILAASHSNYDKPLQKFGTVIDAGGNQTAPPLFVGAAAGNFAEAAGSPTIDAGVANAELGPLDLAGNPRTLGSAPDIGAYEFVPPAPPPAPGALQSLKVAPSAFKTANVGGAVLSAKGKKKPSGPIGGTVSFSVTAPGEVTFKVERAASGRKVGKKCAKKTAANAAKPKCKRFVPVKGSFTHAGTAGANHFKFSGRIAGRTLKPGRYALVGTGGGVTKRASFKIVG